MEDNLGPCWRKASYSGNGGGNCVEVGDTGGVILVRDTTNRRGLTLTVPAEAWQAFTATLR